MHLLRFALAFSQFELLIPSPCLVTKLCNAFGPGPSNKKDETAGSEQVQDKGQLTVPPHREGFKGKVFKVYRRQDRISSHPGIGFQKLINCNVFLSQDL